MKKKTKKKLDLILWVLGLIAMALLVWGIVDILI